MRKISLSPKWLFSIPLAVVLLIAVACGEAAEPSTQAVTQALPTATQVSVPATEPPAAEPAATGPDATTAPVSDNTAAPTPQVVFTIVPTSTPVPEGETVSFPLTPDWVSQGKQSDKVLRFTSRSKPGQWDVHYCASLWSCLKVSGPKFNQLIEYDPDKPHSDHLRPLRELDGDGSRARPIPSDSMTPSGATAGPSPRRT